MQNTDALKFDDYFKKLKARFTEAELTYFQSNVEGELINLIQKYGFDADGIILNAGGYTHTSVAIADAISQLVSQPEMAEAMGRRGREAVERKYNWELESTKLIKLYETLL